MDNDNATLIKQVCADYDNDPRRMMDILWRVQDKLRCIDGEAMSLIASLTGTYRVEVEGVVSFYAFFSDKRKGDITIRLCDDIVDRHAGAQAIAEAFSDALGIQPGETSADGAFSLEFTPCIGMCDQAPAALINDVVVTRLTPAKVKSILRTLRKSKDPQTLIGKTGDGANGHPLVQAMVRNNIRQPGPVLLTDADPEQGLRAALQLSPLEVIAQVEESLLRGRGGAGFPTGRKWRLAANTPAEERYVICNADEGEPGTFKDRVLLTEKPDLLFAGMTIAAYAVGARHGILYLRGEYRYLRAYLEEKLQQRREQNLLGASILGRDDFAFDIRIQMGAGAYICGEESSLISSCEGKRGEPKNRPPFPVQSGYLGHPTVVNNVETLSCVPRIMEQGAQWFRGMGTTGSSGTKLLSISGDCVRPGIYEVAFGVTLEEILAQAGAQDAAAIVVGGASGQIVGRTEFHRRLCFEDLASAGAIVCFNSSRNILEAAAYYMDFFIEESCGYCTPCRVGNVFLKKGLEKIMHGEGEPEDLDYLRNLSDTIIATSRCGLGHTSPNPILSTMEYFPLVYSAMVKERPGGMQAGFNIQKALDEARIIAKRRSLIYDPAYGDKE
ncbi:NADH:ubiquinone oxidoreductase [Hahella sp. KA22]|uniref:NAD(P)H-dependent oxidoreductase subunit E n=1 Tax=Hahella sp. KA22 TaxID=1628392 RepID=UPI000FDCE773|nr:NAD(P)H-dependent oxidoreductase subunit E [Hahella sp. KA22]AZZ89741.1 NADH:ubiquinone oxidoreductase [Hahella sp. KA22]QAY53111.1 NADH:ubiquinone oxidoreductase [Hahella sp. KA22]